MVWERTLPTVIYLNRHDVYRFVITFTDNCSEPRRIEEECFDQAHLSIHATSRDYLRVVVKKTVNYVYNSVQYTVEVRDRGAQTLQHRPGEGMLTNGLHLQGWHRSRKCISNETNNMLYNHPLTVQLGCPPGLRISFDARSTAAVSDPHWNEKCDGPQQISPCFDYETVFRPQFRVEDLVTETSSLFDNLYSVNVIGMGTGLTETSITLFTDAERLNYNSVNGNSALWTRSDGQTTRGSVFQGSTMNGISWVCGPGSPCNELKPASATAPIKLYLLIEFSNRNVSQDYCDFTFQFIIQLRSIPIGSITTITALLASFSSLVTLLLAMYTFHSFAIGSKLQTLLHRVQLWMHRALQRFRVHPAFATGEG
ncbi:cation channel sperm-associated auxiliary subunit gamma-like [Corticium candelabrum]|uniref:cation channel sperm-associated auxiliary subunit gamma-like n=1 Tax=Corticium candelabrum TaxID=121492 RepID=UPI002E267118|nr:cation channel sperm-associated auxiliary subunit gamma-like [Corticium candelabrum]